MRSCSLFICKTERKEDIGRTRSNTGYSLIFWWRDERTYCELSTENRYSRRFLLVMSMDQAQSSLKTSENLNEDVTDMRISSHLWPR